MGLSNEFASTAAQVLPVLAFSAIVQLELLADRSPKLKRKHRRDWRKRAKFYGSRFANLFDTVIVCAFLLCAAWAEILCLNALQGEATDVGDVVFVRRTVAGGLFLLIAVPAVGPVLYAVGRPLQKINARLRALNAQLWGQHRDQWKVFRQAWRDTRDRRSKQ